MAYTKRQLNRILNVGSRPLIDPDEPLPYPARVAESLIRRRTYALEDDTVREQWRMYQRAFDDIQAHALEQARQRRLDTLENNSASLTWRRAVDNAARIRLRQLADEVSRRALFRAGQAYLLGYYGRAWLLDVATDPDTQVYAPQPSNVGITRAVVQPGLTEEWQPNEQIYDALGAEWRQTYADQLDDLIRRIRSTLQVSVQQRESLTLAMNRAADLMGINISRTDGFRANFNRVQTLTRAYVMSASNEGALDLYRRNAPLLEGVQFLAANDGRVCPMCRRLNGTVWPIGSDEIIVPPQGTHWNCRCTLIPRVSLSLPLPLPPRQTWMEWVAMMGLGWLLGDELTDIDLDSSQIGDDEAELEDVI